MLFRLTASTAVMLATAGCIGESDPPMPRVGEICSISAEAVPAGGFTGSEVVIEVSTSSGCAAGEACAVYQLTGNPRTDCTTDCADPNERARRVFCTCRCNTPTLGADLCSCPASFRCEEVSGGESYCVPMAL